MKSRALLSAVLLCLAGPALAQGAKAAKKEPARPEASKPAPPQAAPGPLTAEKARAELKDAQGKTVGEVTFTQTPHGTLVEGDLSNLPAGTHAIHVHEVGRCEPPFKSAGGHFNPMKKHHGMLSPMGLHAGDLPNLHVGADGKVHVEYFAQGLTVKSMADADGSAVILHAGSDDYHSDPAGNAGDRIACGVVTAQ